jgi:hypothetical protein
VLCAPAPQYNDERYYQTATKLELAVADRDWKAARQELLNLLGIEVAGWMFETTAANIERLKKPFAGDDHAAAEIDKVVSALLR